jgi:hypothetical protein
MCPSERSCIFRAPCPDHDQPVSPDPARRLRAKLAARIAASLPPVAITVQAISAWHGGRVALVHLAAVSPITVKMPEGGPPWSRATGQWLCNSARQAADKPAYRARVTCAACAWQAARHGVTYRLHSGYWSQPEPEPEDMHQTA